MVSIITLNYNQNDYTLKCVESLIKSKFKDFLIMIIDNGSSQKNFKDLSEEVPNDPRIQILRLNENLGYVGGVNIGLSNIKIILPITHKKS